VPGIVVYPNPFNPDTAVNGTLKIQGVPPGATVNLYTVSGELVHRETATGALIEWDGKTLNGRVVATGIYYYVVRQGNETLAEGVLVIRRGS
jgi:hypothetical protein